MTTSEMLDALRFLLVVALVLAMGGLDMLRAAEPGALDHARNMTATGGCIGLVMTMRRLLIDLAEVLERHGTTIVAGWDGHTWLVRGDETEQLFAESGASELRKVAAEIAERDQRWAAEAIGDFLRAVGKG